MLREDFRRKMHSLLDEFLFESTRWYDEEDEHEYDFEYWFEFFLCFVEEPEDNEKYSEI